VWTSIRNDYLLEITILMLLLICTCVCALVAIDTIRYIRYNNICNEVFKLNRVEEIDETNYEKFLKDVRNYPKFFCKLFKHFNVDDNINVINIDNIAQSLVFLLNESKKEKIYDAISEIKQCDLIEEIQTIDISRKIKCKIIPFPVAIFLHIYNVVYRWILMLMGFRFISYGNGINMWYSKFDPKKGKPIVFFHSSVGGLASYLFKMWEKLLDMNIIMCEISGFTFEIDCLFENTIENVVDTAYNFVVNEYNYHDQINVMGHSLGSIFCSSWVNKYPYSINRVFCLEGQIFPIGTYMYSSFHKNTNRNDIISEIFVNKNINIIKFTFKNVMIDKHFIYDLENDRKHILLHIIHFAEDDRIPIEYLVEYAKMKSIPVNFHILLGDYSHSHFAVKEEAMINFLQQIEKTYNE
jgi:hypothetical protein